MAEVGEGGWKNETNREVLLPTQISHLMEKLCQAKACSSRKCIVFRLHGCCVSEPWETIAPLHQADLLHLVPLDASCKASFLEFEKEGWTKHTVIQQRRNALWRQSKSSLKMQGGNKISRACQGKLPRCWPKCVGHSDVSPRSCPSPPDFYKGQTRILNLPVWQRQSWDGDFPPPFPKAGSDEVQRPFNNLTNCFQHHPSAFLGQILLPLSGEDSQSPLQSGSVLSLWHPETQLVTNQFEGLCSFKKNKKKGLANKQSKETVRPKWLARIFRWVGCSMCFLHPYLQRGGKWGCLPLINTASKERSWGRKEYHQGCGQIKGKNNDFIKILFKDLEQLSYMDSLNAGVRKT